MSLTMEKFRLIKRNEDGQIMVFTALSIFVLVLFAASVYNVGVVVGEKMQLQNTADAAAYSGAVWEARCFNFWSYTNRAMVAHLVTVAQLTCYVSHATLMKEVWDDVQPVISLIPYVGPALGTAGDYASEGYKIAAEAAATVGIPAASGVNYFLSGSQYGMEVLLHGELITHMFLEDIVRENDPDATLNEGVGILLRGINELEFLGAFSRSGDWRKMRDATFKSVPGFVWAEDGDDRGWSSPWWWPISGLRWVADFSISRTDMSARDRLQELIGAFGLGWWVTSHDSWGRFWEWKPIRASKYGYQGIPSFYEFTGDPNDLPSVYVLTSKSEGMPQINLKNITFDGELYAISRAQVYYRRPDDHSERPNFFNPYWGAKLAPANKLISDVSFGLDGLISDITFGFIDVKDFVTH